MVDRISFFEHNYWRSNFSQPGGEDLCSVPAFVQQAETRTRPHGSALDPATSKGWLRNEPYFLEDWGRAVEQYDRSVEHMGYEWFRYSDAICNNSTGQIVRSSPYQSTVNPQDLLRQPLATAPEITNLNRTSQASGTTMALLQPATFFTASLPLRTIKKQISFQDDDVKHNPSQLSKNDQPQTGEAAAKEEEGQTAQQTLATALLTLKAEKNSLFRMKTTSQLFPIVAYGRSNAMSYFENWCEMSAGFWVELSCPVCKSNIKMMRGGLPMLLKGPKAFSQHLGKKHGQKSPPEGRRGFKWMLSICTVATLQRLPAVEDLSAREPDDERTWKANACAAGL